MNHIKLTGYIVDLKIHKLPSGDWLTEFTISTYTTRGKKMHHNCKAIQSEPLQIATAQSIHLDGELIYETYRGVTIAKIYVKKHHIEND